MRFLDSFPVLALTSDATLDFTAVDFNAPLSAGQQCYLKSQTGRDIPCVFWRRQVHEDKVIVARGVPSDCARFPPADAFVCAQAGLPIAIRTADCVPVFIFDPVQKVIGLAHAGWKGSKAEIALKTLQTMQDKFDSQCYDLHVALGPAIRACCYEVGPEFQEHFPQDTREEGGRQTVDIVAANRRQLQDAGIKAENIVDSKVCTVCDPGYFSFRRDGLKAGRMISVMMLL